MPAPKKDWTPAFGQIRNSGGFERPEQKIDMLLAIKGILKKIYGELHDALFFDNETDFCLQVCEKVYWMKNIREIFPRRVNKRAIANQMETVFRSFRPDGTWTPMR